jgi:hypothetical protein
MALVADKSGNGILDFTRHRSKNEAMGPAVKTWSVVKSDTVNFDQMATEIYCGTGGTVACVMEDGTVQSFTVPDGGRISAHVKRVNSTATTASNMVASV